MAGVLSFSIPKQKLREITAIIEQLAKIETVSKSEVIVRAIEEYFERHGRGNPTIPLPVFAGETVPPETYALLEALKRRYGHRQTITWDDALYEFRKLLSIKKLDIVERVLDILEKEGWRVARY